MISVGIDVGAKNIKIIALKDGEIIAKGQSLAGFETKETAKVLYDDVLKKANISPEDVNSITSTGSGRKAAEFASNSVTEVTAAAKGATNLFPSVRCVIDVGAEEGRTIRCDNNGKIVDFALNEKCAAGAGAFIEAMARALEVSIEEFGTLSMKSDIDIPLNAQCAVFAESEVVSLLHAKTEKKDIAKAVNDAVASRITSIGTDNKSAKTSIPRPVPAAHLSFIKKFVTLPFSSIRIALQSCPPISRIVRTVLPYIIFAPLAWQAISVIVLFANGTFTLP